ncbi:hypothetical protein C3L33_05776, partial [Rhododendron williamsianum]
MRDKDTSSRGEGKRPAKGHLSKEEGSIRPRIIVRRRKRASSQTHPPTEEGSVQPRRVLPRCAPKIKEFPGYNFIGIIFDPASDTQKRLEKVEITSSDGNEAKGTFEELYVQVSADTYEKVDAAVALIEMLVTPVSVNQSAVSTTPTSVSTENAAVVEQSQGTSTPNTTPPFGVNQEPANPMMGSAQAPQAQFQPYQDHSNQFYSALSWFSRLLLVNMAHQEILNLVFQLHLHLWVINLLQQGIPRSQDIRAFTISTHAHNHIRIAHHIVSFSRVPNHDFTTHYWIRSSPSNNSTVNMVSPRPMQSSSPIPQSQLFMARAATPNPNPNPLFGSNPIAPPVASTSTPPPPLPPPSQGGIPSFTPIKPQHPIAGDFTFQPHWPHNSASQAVPRPGTQPMMQNMRPTNPIAPPPQLPQSPSFRPAIQPSSSQPLMQGIIPRPQLSNQMNPFAGNPTANSAPLRNPLFPNPTPMPPNSVGPQMGLRNLNQTPFPHGPGIPLQIPPNFQAARGRPPNQHRGGLAFGPGSQQIYDPFSPSSVSAAAIQGGAVPKMRKQESDPEYEDLMASVGVK